MAIRYLGSRVPARLTDGVSEGYVADSLDVDLTQLADDNNNIATLQAGDFLIGFYATGYDSNDQYGPSGWTPLHKLRPNTANDDKIHYGVYYKIVEDGVETAGGTDTVATFTSQSITAQVAAVAAYRGVDPDSPIDDWQYKYIYHEDDDIHVGKPGETITLSADGSAIVLGVAYHQEAGYDPYTFSPGYEQRGWIDATELSASDRNIGWGDKVGAAAGDYVGDPDAVVFVDPTGNSQHGIMIGLRPGNQPPYAPELRDPANGAVLDLTGTPLFRWYFRDPNLNDDQRDFAFRRRPADGSGTDEWWNVGTLAWQASQVWNADSNEQYQFPSGAWLNGDSWAWSVATRDLYSEPGPYAADSVVTGSTGPTVTVDAPTEVVASLQPWVRWGYSDPDGDPQGTWQARIIASAVYSASGFDPATAAAVWDSGEKSSETRRSVQVGTALENGATYRAYVRVSDSVGSYSGWAYRTFRTSVSNPESPGLTAATDVPGDRTIATLQPVGSIFDADTGTLEGSLGTWAADGNATIERNAAAARNGGYGLAVTASAAGDAFAVTATGLSGVPVVAGDGYTMALSVRVPGATGRLIQPAVQWYDDAGTYLSETVFDGQTVADTDGWVTFHGSVIAAGAATHAAVRIAVRSAALGEVFYFDDLAMALGTLDVRTDGRLLQEVRLERSEDDGDTWAVVGNSRHPVDPDTGAAEVYDYAPPPGTPTLYRAFTHSSSDLGEDQLSAPSPLREVTFALPNVRMKDPAAPEAFIDVSVRLGGETTERERVGRFRPIGRRAIQHVADVVELESGALTFQFRTEAEYQAFRALRNRQTTLLLRWPYKQQYVRLHGDLPATLTVAVGDTKLRAVEVAYDEQEVA